MNAALQVEAFGVPFEVVCRGLPPEVVEDVWRALPPGWSRTTRPPRWSVTVSHDNHGWTIAGLGNDATYDNLSWFLHRIESDIALAVAEQAPGLVFIHAGVVGTSQGAIILPGVSFTGKTTLVAELLRQGCSYLSDEYAVLDAAGIVHPYPRRLSIRAANPEDRLPTPAAALGADVSAPAIVRAVVAMRYEAGATFELHPSGPGDTMMTLLANAIAAQSRGPEVMATCALLVRHTRGLSGTRGDAAEAATLLLAALDEGDPR